MMDWFASVHLSPALPLILPAGPRAPCSLALSSEGGTGPAGRLAGRAGTRRRRRRAPAIPYWLARTCGRGAQSGDKGMERGVPEEDDGEVSVSPAPPRPARMRVRLASLCAGQRGAGASCEQPSPRNRPPAVSGHTAPLAPPRWQL